MNWQGKETESRLYVWAAFRLYSFAVAFVVVMGIGISGRVVRRIVVVAEFFVWSKAVMSREVVEETIVVCTLPVFETFELNLTRLLFLGFVDFFSRVGDIVRID